MAEPATLSTLCWISRRASWTFSPSFPSALCLALVSASVASRAFFPSSFLSSSPLFHASSAIRLASRQPWMRRSRPGGHSVLRQVSHFPQLQLHGHELSQQPGARSSHSSARASSGGLTKKSTAARVAALRTGRMFITWRPGARILVSSRLRRQRAPWPRLAAVSTRLRGTPLSVPRPKGKHTT